MILDDNDNDGRNDNDATYQEMKIANNKSQKILKILK